MGADGAAVRDQRQGGKWHGRATSFLPGGRPRPGTRQMQQYQGSGHRSSTVSADDPSYQVNPDGSIVRAPVQQPDPYGGYPTYDPTMMDPGYAQQYYGGVAYPGQSWGGGVPVSYGGYSAYGGTYGGGYGGDFGSDLEQYQADLQAWMDQ